MYNRRLKRALESGVPLVSGAPTEGERRENERLISQVTGQMGGTRTGSAAFVLEDLWDDVHLSSSYIRN